MRQYLYFDSKGQSHTILPVTPVLDRTIGQDRNAKKLVVLSRLDCDLRVVEVPETGRDTRAVLEARMASLYPGSPSDTTFDFRRIDRRRVVLFITRSSLLDQYRSSAPDAAFVLPYSLIKRWLEERPTQTKKTEKTLCIFLWFEWCEVLLFNGSQIDSSRVVRRGDDLKALAEQIESLVPDAFRDAPRYLFCSDRDSLDFRPMVDGPIERVVSVEDILRKTVRRRDSIFNAHPPFLHRYKREVAAGAFLLLSLLFMALTSVGARIQRQRFERLGARAESVQELLGLVERKEALEAQLAEAEDLRTRNTFLFLSRLEERLGEDTEILRLVLDERNGFQLEGRTPESLSLVSRLGESSWFSSIRLTGVAKDPVTGKERFNLLGVYGER
jgi:hypothetical protein